MLRRGDHGVLAALTPLGAEAGTAQARQHGPLVNAHEPVLTPYDRYDNRIDEVEFHPSRHWLMDRAVGLGLAATPLEAGAAGAPHATCAAAGFMASSPEPGHGCPMSMT